MYLTAQEAAAELGVSVTTLYSYVSRKQIRSQRAPGSKARHYWREDIERLKRAPQTSVGDLLVPSSSITLLTEEGPFYRGRSALRLAETETLESVCEILWGLPSEGAFTSDSFRRPPLYGTILKGLSDATTLQKVFALLPILERANPRAYDLSPAGYCRTGAEIMRWFCEIICGSETRSNLPMHETIAKGLKAPPGYSEIIRRLFVLYADHELDPSSYAVRAVANTGVSAYQIVGAGLASAMGRRLTFGRIEAFSQMMQEIMTKPDPKSAILRRLREGEPVYGFGSRLYPTGDPRAASLLDALNQSQPDDPELARLNAAIAVANEVMGELPDFSIVVLFISHKLGLAGGEGSLARLTRIAGWIAHASEQFHTQELVRPRTIYVGALPDQDSLRTRRLSGRETTRSRSRD